MIKQIILCALLGVSNSLENKCKAESTREYKGEVIKVMDGEENNRCFSLFTPINITFYETMPVLLWFHGSGGSAEDCGKVK